MPSNNPKNVSLLTLTIQSSLTVHEYTLMIYTRFNGLLQTEFRLWSACKLADEDEDEDEGEDEVIESCWWNCQN